MAGEIKKLNKLDLGASFEALRGCETEARQYVALLAAANSRARLTGPKDEDVLWHEHVADCAAVVSAIPQNARVLDMGTGGGLPGIIWSLCRPDISVTMLDSVAKKCALVAEFLQMMSLPVQRAIVICARSEDFARLNREYFDVAAARAVSEAGVLAEYLSPLVAVGGYAFAFKGPRAQSELEGVGGKWAQIGLGEPQILQYNVTDKEHSLVVWEKISPCPKKYPRRPGLAQKSPWYK